MFIVQVVRLYNSNSMNTENCSTLTLSDGNSWAILSGDEVGLQVAKVLTNTMQLRSSSSNGQRLVVVKNGNFFDTMHSCFPPYPKITTSEAQDTSVEFQISKPNNNNELAILLMKLSLIFCSVAEARGGLLIHGALAEKDGSGIILAGPGDVGKTTASRRLPSPWKSLSDDCTLVVLDEKGFYRAHPWPTWSSFMFGGEGGSWDVQYSVPLKNIFFLVQDDTDHAEPVGKGKAVCMLNESAEQAWFVLTNDLDKEKKKTLHLQRFNNICELIDRVPAHLLHISKTGAFWEEIEKVLPVN